ncbi:MULTISPECIES: ATP-binding protein [unclassified Bradyrhizobium]|uniref:ATP-binding protein n=1 Tax=unclassified Bradyrhizobium TaxID=2631580 RepID=UPI002915F0C3|nr:MULTISPECIES: ATP-binding protein [unclassified Bradyrhizobium]
MSLLSPDQLRKTITPEPTSAWPSEPYKGLNYFQRSDAPLFSERDIDVCSCAAIVGFATNKVLLLHGRSGTGKSSFLRAGLLPKLQQAGFYSFETKANGDEPLLVRCTANPLLRLQHALTHRLTNSDASNALGGFGRKRALSLLQAATSDDPTDIAEQLLAAFQALSNGSSRPILFVIDQGEEIFTLGTANEIRAAFFYLIEELCIRHIDLKLIVSIRTEFYGQFCDQLRVAPNLTVTTSRTSLDQYMLHGLRTESQIVATIVRPTLNEPVSSYGIPRSVYNFAFEVGTAEQIAADLLQHCGESSTLPVMQIVCRDLFRSVVGESRPASCRLISLRDYDRLGRVSGRVNAFINSSIRNVLKSVNNANPTESEVSRWQEVLANLVARQEGSVLASLLVDEDEIIADAKSRGITGNISQCLKEMASEHSGLLRISEGAGSTQFSLGHDALAPSLFQWREARADILRERRSAKRITIALAIASALIVVFTAVVFWQIYQNRSQTLQLISALSNNDSSPGYRTRVLLSLAASIESSGLLSKQLLHQDHLFDLRQNLLRSPVFVGKPSIAIGLYDDKITRLDATGKIWHQPLANPAAEQLIGIIPPRTAEDQSPCAIGRISGLTRPIVYQGGYVYWWPDQARPDEPQRLELKSLFPTGFGTTGFTLVDIANGHLRATQITSSPRIYRFLEISFSGSRFVASDIKELPWSYALWPVFSPYSDKLAFLSGRELLQSDRLQPSSIKKVGSLADPTKSNKEISEIAPGPAPELFLESIGFAPSDAAILVRGRRSEIFIFRAETPLPLRLGIYETLQDAPIRPRFGFSRPLIAGVKIADNWRAAWVGDEGIDMLEGSEDGLGRLVRVKSLLPAAPLDSIIRIEFSRDGRWLLAVSQSGFLEPAVFRIWDLSSAYVTELDGMTVEQLRDKACFVAGLEASNKFSAIELRNLFAGRERQPCGDK